MPNLALFLGLSLIGVVAASVSAGAQSTPAPPATRKIPEVSQLHGERRVDDYGWMRGKNKPEVTAHLEAENGYTEAVMAPTRALQKTLYDEMLGHIKQTDLSVPYRLGEFYYYTRTDEGKQYPLYARKRGTLEAAEEVLLDVNALAAGKTFMSVGSFVVSDDGKRLAYTTDDTGYRQYTLHVKDLQTGTLLPDTAQRVDTLMWATDNETLFYSTEDEITKRNDSLWRHRLGGARAELVYKEPDELYDVYAERSRDRRYVFLVSESKTDNEARYLDANRPNDSLKLIAPRRPDLKYYPDHRDGNFYFVTNLNAKNYRVMRAPASDPSPSRWQSFIEHRPAVKIEAINLFKRFAVLSERENGLSQLEIIDFANGNRRRIAFDEPAYTVAASANPEYETDTFRYTYQSMVTPSTVYEDSFVDGKRTLLKTTEVPKYDKARYVTARVYATATDGTKIPIALVHRSDVKLDGTAPLLLYGYGSYGVSLPDGFSATRLPLLDRGVVYAIAHVRGGGEQGEEWREAGRLMQKRTTFTDFIASAEYLGRGIVASDKIVIQGGSAGGLLMGAVANLRPELFRAVIAQVPFVDVLNTMLDASLPLTTGEYREWGNPNEKAAYDYMRTYSPYDNVSKRAYPAMLVEVSLNDSQVPYWEGAKFAARVRENSTSGKPVLLKTNLGAGHGGASGRYDALHETAFNYAYVLSQVGITQ